MRIDGVRRRFENFDGDAQEVMDRAEEQAKKWRHEYVGTEHVLLGLLELRNNMISQLLSSFGRSECDIRARIESLVTKGPEIVVTGNLPVTPRVKTVIRYALERADGHEVRVEHLLLGLHWEQDSVACQAMNLPCNDKELRHRITELKHKGRGEET